MKHDHRVVFRDAMKPLWTWEERILALIAGALVAGLIVWAASVVVGL